MPLASLFLCVLSAAQAAPVQKPEKREKVVLDRGKKFPVYMELSLASEEPATPMLVLYHEARSSLGEYRPIVPRLRELGYNCLAVDLSCGGACRETKNKTAAFAAKGGNVSDYLSVLPEMEESLLWAREHHAHGKLVAWGSSYTASLALYLAAERPDLVDGVVAFAPGEYFTALKKSPTWIRESAARVQCPAFLTSGKGEDEAWKAIFEAIPADTKKGFFPTVEGAHGSRALWSESAGTEEYWAALEPFLKQHFPSSAVPPKDE